MTGYVRTYYSATAHAAPDRPPLAGDVTCDVCVIGAGYAGLSTALHLAESGKKVVVLEAEKVGWGASGRNGGQVINGYSRDYDDNRRHYGEDSARALLEMNFEGANIIRQWISQYNIDCDWKEGAFFAALNARQMHGLERTRELWEKAGNKGLEMFDRTRVCEASNTDLYCGGLLDRQGGHIHPLNLALGEARAIESLGGKIYEGSRALSITQGVKPTAITAKGRVIADTLVLCGNAYLGDTVPKLSCRIMSVSSHIVATEPLGSDVARRLMPANYSVEDCNFLLDYYRMSTDNRLLFGGGVSYGGRTASDIASLLAPRIARVFPELAAVPLDFSWSCNFALTLTRMFHVGRLSDSVYFIQGDSGHGVAPCHLLGKLTAAAINRQSAGFDVFAGLRNYPFPGGRAFRVSLVTLGAWYYMLKEKLGL